jgi:ferritin-like protein
MSTYERLMKITGHADPAIYDILLLVFEQEIKHEENLHSLLIAFQVNAVQ